MFKSALGGEKLVQTRTLSDLLDLKIYNFVKNTKVLADIRQHTEK
jgi:hypothetical protein